MVQDKPVNGRIVLSMFYQSEVSWLPLKLTVKYSCALLETQPNNFSANSLGHISDTNLFGGKLAQRSSLTRAVLVGWRLVYECFFCRRGSFHFTISPVLDSSCEENSKALDLSVTAAKISVFNKIRFFGESVLQKLSKREWHAGLFCSYSGSTGFLAKFSVFLDEQRGVVCGNNDWPAAGANSCMPAVQQFGEIMNTEKAISILQEYLIIVIHIALVKTQREFLSCFAQDKRTWQNGPPFLVFEHQDKSLFH